MSLSKRLYNKKVNRLAKQVLRNAGIKTQKRGWVQFSLYNEHGMCLEGAISAAIVTVVLKENLARYVDEHGGELPYPNEFPGKLASAVGARANDMLYNRLIMTDVDFGEKYDHVLAADVLGDYAWANAMGRESARRERIMGRLYSYNDNLPAETGGECVVAALMKAGR